MKIVNLSDLSPDWIWLKDEFRETNQDWLHYSSQSVHLPKTLPKKASIERAVAALRAVAQCRKERSVLVSHGPRPAFYGASLAKILCPTVPHLVYSFNFTDLPQGAQRSLMAKAYRQAKKFVTYSTVERALYADYFEIPIDSIDMLHWAVHPPKVNLSENPIETGPYICALGSQGRDYQTLFEAMRRIKSLKLVVVASMDNIKDLDIPPNVTVHTNIPLTKAHNILAHSQFMVLPLRDSQVPCGHVTIVSSMFFKKAILVTNSQGAYDYVQDGETGVFCNPQDPDDWANKIELLLNNPSKIATLSEAGFRFANIHCTEKTVVNYFSNFLSQIS